MDQTVLVLGQGRESVFTTALIVLCIPLPYIETMGLFPYLRPTFLQPSHSYTFLGYLGGLSHVKANFYTASFCPFGNQAISGEV